jgi:hypothetical protein
MERRTYVERDDDGVVEERVESRRVRSGDYGEPVVSDSVVESRSSYFDSISGRVNSVLFAVMFALEGLLALRFVLQAFGANRNSGFVDFVMNVSWPFVRPFDGAFNNRTWDQGIIEVSTLLAMAVWFLVFALAAMLVSALLPRFYGSDGYHRRHVTHA